MAKFTLSLNGPLLKIPNSIAKESFDYVGRYQLIAEIITRYFGDSGPKNLLDVGGLGTFLDQILDVPITILDEEASEGTDGQAKGDGAQMKIADGTYDAVVTSDTLEHIPKKDRKSFVNELIRVSNDLIILCAPFGDNGAKAEEATLQANYSKLIGHPHRWLKEHADYGLPITSEIMACFRANNVSVVQFGQSSIELWRQLMTANLVANDMDNKLVQAKLHHLNSFYNQHILFDDFTNYSYRTFFVASKKRNLTASIKQELTPSKHYPGLLTKLGDFYQTALIHAESAPIIKKKVDDFTRDRTALSNQVIDLKLQMDHLVHSKSWRVTAPIRRLETTVRKKTPTKGDA